jgi:hypothetical protein
VKLDHIFPKMTTLPMIHLFKVLLMKGIYLNISLVLNITISN